MTRSIFDPTSPNVERSGDTFTGPDANQISHMPAGAVDGVVERRGTVADTVEFDAAGEPSSAGGEPAVEADAVASASADPIEVDGGLDEVQDAHALNMGKRAQAETGHP